VSAAKELPPRCGVPWPICPDCLGEPLDRAQGRSFCPRCRRAWLDEERDPCPDPATSLVRDAQGGELRMCRSHAVRAAVQIVGARAEGLDLAASAVVATLRARDQETARLRAAHRTQAIAELSGEVTPLDPERRSEIRQLNRMLDALERPRKTDKDKP
jgi:hypothetical protein